MPLSFRALLLCAALFSAPMGVHAQSSMQGMVALSSRVFNGYARTRLTDGSLKIETYAFGNGGFVTAGSAGADTPGASRDQSIDNLGFNEIAKAMEAPLSGQNYALSQDPNATNILVMVFLGTTVGGFHEKKGKFRDILNLKNAQMMAALQVNRYFVILRGFDFQSSWKEKKLRLLWETRFSIDQRGNAFNEALPLMAQYASPNFGQDSAGLQLARVREGRVEVGNIESLGEVTPAPQK